MIEAHAYYKSLSGRKKEKKSVMECQNMLKDMLEGSSKSQEEAVTQSYYEDQYSLLRVSDTFLRNRSGCT